MVIDLSESIRDALDIIPEKSLECGQQVRRLHGEWGIVATRVLDEEAVLCYFTVSGNINDNVTVAFDIGREFDYRVGVTNHIGITIENSQAEAIDGNPVRIRVQLLLVLLDVRCVELGSPNASRDDGYGQGASGHRDGFCELYEWWPYIEMVVLMIFAVAILHLLPDVDLGSQPRTGLIEAVGEEGVYLLLIIGNSDVPAAGKAVRVHPFKVLFEGS